ncbi:MAG TPA: hypothetical protein VFN49_01595 [Candidatus Aquilonibacter sp.]|nr:hypothetical protein [Candidatus Aquilonibacter sp.]
MQSKIAAHLIVGPRPEPFLGPLLSSLERVADVLIVNDNGPQASPHAEALAQSAFARSGAMLVDRTPFTSFSDARNVCMRLHAERVRAPWIAFIDADEVHGEAVELVARHLDLVPPEIGAVDAYTWHFFGSFDWYTSIERRMMFFRFNDDVRWINPVHEQLVGIPSQRIALPYVYAHYGHTLDPRRHAEKGRQYSHLGAPGDILSEDELDDIDVRSYYAEYFPRLLPFRGEHPHAALPVIAELRRGLAPLYALTDRIAREQPLPVKIRNAVRAANYAQRWRLRILNPLAAKLMRR